MEIEEETYNNQDQNKQKNNLFFLTPAINFRNIKKIYLKNKNSDYKIKYTNTANDFKYFDNGNTIKLPKIKSTEFKN